MGKSITIKHIAAAAGVSIRTVSLALNGEGSISEATRDRVRAIAAELGYRPNLVAKSLAGSKTYLVGVNFPFLNLSFLNAIVAGIERRCVEYRYEILLCSSSFKDISLSVDDLEAEKATLERMLLRRVDGIICLPDPRAYGLYAELGREGTPLLQVLRAVPYLDAPSIRVDNEAGSFMATKHLLDLGHRSIAFLASDRPNFEEIEDRYRGYLRAFAGAEATIDTARLSAASDLSVAGGYAAAAKLLARAPELTAIVAPTDYAAVGAVKACLDAGKRVPEDVSVVGYDDLEIAEHQVSVPLTTVRQPKERLGELAAETMYRMINGEKAESLRLMPELVVRSSTGAPPR